jgi:hypothetical protein
MLSGRHTTPPVPVGIEMRSLSLAESQCTAGGMDRTPIMQSLTSDLQYEDRQIRDLI